MNELEDAIWAGDIDKLQELAPCRCCCAEHTFSSCLARLWGGCRGGFGSEDEQPEAWFEFYAATRGMTREEFFGETA